ncbi:hypothetical protein ACIPC1_10345 [Streptomyces sp. NPDC087263]|uniref:hypothetical protein n=1 Tax=Streptomyces sp. NPDC087263 TaxID=3365773 RepID=UPI00382F5550
MLYEEYVERLAPKALSPSGGIAASGAGARLGGEANLEAFTEVRWTTVSGGAAPYPF